MDDGAAGGHPSTESVSVRSKDVEYRPPGAALWFAYAGLAFFVFHVSWAASASLVAIVLAWACFNVPRKTPLVLVLSPILTVPAISFFGGCASYAAGQAELLRTGMAWRENPDPISRCTWRTSGCIVDGTEFLRQPPNNAAVRLMSWAFGPMPGAYDGPYPALDDVRNRLANPRGWASAAQEPLTPPADLFCNTCNQPEPAIRHLGLDDRGVLIAGAHTAMIYDRRQRRVFACYDLNERKD